MRFDPLLMGFSKYLLFVIVLWTVVILLRKML